uniref:Uncharacterized protein isoform X1 n=1 Tax=Pogona vitticeps TaxID=103695 RepID=A0A6J0SDB0_9SAUR
MNLWPDKILLPATFFVLLFLGSTATSSLSVIQKPTFVNLTEGSMLNMECWVDGNLTGIWSITWRNGGCDGKEKFTNSSRILITPNEAEKSSHFSLKRADIQDAGNYVCCFCDAEIFQAVYNRTRVVIHEITDLMVNQTSGDIEIMEGENITLECRFKTVGNLSNMYVRWYKNETLLSNQTEEQTLNEDLEEGFSSLTLWKAHTSRSGMYRCEVGVRGRNLTGSGKESRIIISGQLPSEQKTNPDQKPGSENHKEAGAGFEIGVAAGAAVGVFLFLLLIGVFVWRQKKRGSPAATSGTESDANEEAGKQHLPLAGQMSDVTYADLRFKRNEGQPESEVVYAEVKPGRQQRAGINGRPQAKVRGSH